MRLTSSQIESIRSAVHKVLGERVTIRLFGSRVRDDLKGGDIDLFLETDYVLENRVASICAVQGALLRALGERKVDILIKDPRTPDARIFAIATRTGVVL